MRWAWNSVRFKIGSRDPIIGCLEPLWQQITAASTKVL